jgi:hypothetical protein
MANPPQNVFTATTTQDIMDNARMREEIWELFQEIGKIGMMRPF